MTAVVAAAGRHQPECGDGERESPRRRQRPTAGWYEEPRHPDRAQREWPLCRQKANRGASHVATATTYTRASALKGGREMKKRVLRFCVAIAVLGIAAMALASSVFAQNYIILYKQNAVASDAAATVKNAGGSMIAAYPQIGVVIARSNSSSFGTAVLKDSRVDSAAATRGFGVKLKDQTLAPSGPLPGGLPNSSATDSDNLSGLQWDM